MTVIEFGKSHHMSILVRRHAHEVRETRSLNHIDYIISYGYRNCITIYGYRIFSLVFKTRLCVYSPLKITTCIPKLFRKV